MNQTRRDFVKKTASAALSVPFMMPSFDGIVMKDKELNISIFSKHLQFLDVKGAAQIAAELGFNGLDLTVRPKGHVLPAHVSKDLATSVLAIRKAGSECKMITTAIESADNKEDAALIQEAAMAGIAYYRSNWFKYQKGRDMTASIAYYQNEIKKLSELNRQSGIIGCYQNHAGTKIGASFWELKMLLDTADKDYFGVQFDIRHALAEAAFSWENGLRLLHKSIKTIVLKDFKWTMEKGKRVLVNVPIGEGMVDFQSYFKLLKQYQLNPPVSLHLEYPLGGADKGRDSLSIDKSLVYAAMSKDLQRIRDYWSQA